MKKLVLACALAASIAACSDEQPSGKFHRSTATADALVGTTGAHSVQRDVTASGYCLDCHAQYATGGHPLGVSLPEAAMLFPGQYFAAPADPAIVLVNGATVECSSCHDDGAAGLPFLTTTTSSCDACHDKDGVPAPDAAVPTVSLAPLSSPARGTISVSASVADDVGVVRAQLRVGCDPYATGAPLATVLYPAAAVTFSLDTTTLPDGATCVEVRVHDAAQHAASATATVTIDNGAPTVAIAGPQAGALVRGTVAISATGTWVSRAELWAGAAPGTLVSTIEPTTGSFTLPLDTTTLPDGLTDLVVRVYDSAQQVASAATTLRIDNGAPVVAITSPADGASLKGAVTLGAAASDGVGVARVDFYVDGVLLATSTGPAYSATWTPVRHSGIHALEAVATDLAGNVATSPKVTVLAR